ncbi:MAG: hypothetical protein GF334_02735 [Candidatus Altiarchaeales archaeon]|nr:hypothetical protein [Candidatus Altiarchaeales archaeon]
MVTTISKSINTLVADIGDVLREDYIHSHGSIDSLGYRINETLRKRLAEEKEEGSGLRMSNFGSKCDRKLWYTVNRPEEKEPLLPHTRLKFLYGDVLEEVILTLAQEAGHRVEGEQDTLTLEGVVGHRDAVIDGVLIDVKSANSRQFTRYKQPVSDLKDDIWFSTYIDQLQLYLEASKDDPLVEVKDTAGFLVVDKELGHVTLKLIPRDKSNWKERIARKREMLARSEPPERAFKDEKDGESGNRKLKTYCSYCQFKKICWPGLRTFVSSSGPKHLTVVKREPSLMEVD